MLRETEKRKICHIAKNLLPKKNFYEIIIILRLYYMGGSQIYSKNCTSTNYFSTGICCPSISTKAGKSRGEARTWIFMVYSQLLVTEDMKKTQIQTADQQIKAVATTVASFITSSQPSCLLCQRMQQQKQNITKNFSLNLQLAWWVVTRTHKILFNLLDSIL